MVGYYESYISTKTREKDKQNLKYVRGSQKKTNVATMAEYTSLEDIEKGKTISICVIL